MWLRFNGSGIFPSIWFASGAMLRPMASDATVTANRGRSAPGIALGRNGNHPHVFPALFILLATLASQAGIPSR
jgi:hypothetical protein